MIMTYDEQLKYILNMIKKFDKKQWKYGVLFYIDLIELEENDVDVDIIRENINGDVDKIILGVIPVAFNYLTEEQVDFYYKILKKRMGSYFVYASDYKVMSMDEIIDLIEQDLEDIENG